MKIIVCGAAGKMGQAILSVIDGEDIQLGATIEIGADIKAGLSKGKVVIDFTSPKGTLAILKEAISQNKAMVIGTTGFGREEKKKITVASKKIPIVFSPNMSVGVNVVFKLLADATSALGDAYDVEIVEMHHKNKKDAPSGTALRMGETIAQVRGIKLNDVLRNGVRQKGDIGFCSIRGGDVVGDHTVIFAGHRERVEITHRAHSRKNFAEGALIAARWVVNQPPGLYDMMDVLNLKKLG